MVETVRSWEPHEFYVRSPQCSFCTANNRPLYHLLTGYGQSPFDECAVACEGCLRNLRAAIDEALREASE